MANLKSPKFSILYVFQLLWLVQIQVWSYQFKVGDLSAWGIPTSSNPKVYYFWSKYHTFKIGDSLMFLYPPSQDSVVQVTEQNYNSCNLKDPILYMNNGNSLFNITTEGHFYFTSGNPGHCEKKQKLIISVGNVSDTSASDGPSGMPDNADAPSYSNVFGSMPLSQHSSSASTYKFSMFLSVFIGAVISALIGGNM
ncbi:stellacyanin [Mercurialis annua]|uniref:stellacyanin n=1 Tax=Mercurialis annua TaxID=3986 RepID=UPI00215F6F49|nr:stellacyanin [Mercurialis annua]